MKNTRLRNVNLSTGLFLLLKLHLSSFFLYRAFQDVKVLFLSIFNYYYYYKKNPCPCINDNSLVDWWKWTHPNQIGILKYLLVKTDISLLSFFVHSSILSYLSLLLHLNIHIVSFISFLSFEYTYCTYLLLYQWLTRWTYILGGNRANMLGHTKFFLYIL